MNERQLMHQIQQVSFALVDLNLFLDSHPDNMMAHDFFSEMQTKYTELVAEYEMMF